MDELIFYVAMFIAIMSLPYAMAGPFISYGMMRDAKRMQKAWEAQCAFAREEFERVRRETQNEEAKS